MKIRPSALAIAFLLCLFPVAAAFGQTIQYNRYFTCGGERQSVASCFNDADTANCLVMYPDRPLHNGFEVQITETRGSIIKKIQGCMGAGATLASTGNPAPAPPRPANGAASGGPPSGGRAAGPMTVLAAGGPTPLPDPSAVKARAANVDMTVLGVPLGQPLTMALCRRQSITDLLFSGGTGYVPGQQFPCAESKTVSSGQIANSATPAEISIDFPDGGCPSWSNPCEATGLVRSGVLLSIYIGTNGQTGDPTVSAQLRAKYGKPSVDTVVTFKNLYNYSANFHQLEWNLPGLHVEYHPFLTDIDIGGVWFETETGHQLRAAGQAVQQKAEPKL
jgi:hypothetical protein